MLTNLSYAIIIFTYSKVLLREEEKHMEKTLQAERENQEVIEFITMLKTMSDSEKNQIKGIMIGIGLAKTCLNAS